MLALMAGAVLAGAAPAVVSASAYPTHDAADEEECGGDDQQGDDDVLDDRWHDVEYL